MQTVLNYQFNQLFLVKISVLLTVKNCDIVFLSFVARYNSILLKIN